MDSLVKFDAREARRILISEMTGGQTHGLALVIWRSRLSQFQFFTSFLMNISL